jgi:hypothetical protein
VIRAGVVLRSAAGVAAIERVRDGMTYHVLPGGQVDPGETPAEAARREAHEELGLIVSVGGLLALVHFDGSVQHYFQAEVLGGEFGTGTGKEMSSARIGARDLPGGVAQPGPTRRTGSAAEGDRCGAAGRGGPGQAAQRVVRRRW